MRRVDNALFVHHRFTYSIWQTSPRLGATLFAEHLEIGILQSLFAGQMFYA